MAVIQYQEPSVTEADVDDWNKLIARTTEQGGGFISIGLGNIDNADVPSITAGSRLEVNRAFFHVQSDAAITGNIGAAGRKYIYACPVMVSESPSLSFVYSDITPAWNAEKGGWYQAGTQDRAVATFYYSGGNYQTKIIGSFPN